MLEIYPKEVKLVFKNFPIRDHKFAMKAAIAALTAGKQGKFWEFHDLLFSYYDTLSDQEIRDIAHEMGLDVEEFEKDMKDPEVVAKIKQDIRQGNRLEVMGTPTVFINGRLLRRGDLKGFQTLIEKELKKISHDQRQ